MEPNKIENQIREQLNKREIQPSLQAWDRLDAMLSIEETKIKKQSFSWIKIAASIVFFLGLISFFLNSNVFKNEIQSNTVVFEKPQKVSDSNLKTETFNEADSVKPKVGNAKMAIVKLDVRNTVDKPNTKLDLINVEKNEGVISKIGVENEVASSDIKNETKGVIEKNEVQNIQSKNEVLAEIKSPTGKPKLKVDPNALLNQVDGEIQLTFRQKVMKTVTRGYKEAKEAVASRNQESSINY